MLGPILLSRTVLYRYISSTFEVLQTNNRCRKQQRKRTYAGLRVVRPPLRILVQERSTALAVRPHPVVAAVVAHAAADATRRLEESAVKMTRV